MSAKFLAYVTGCVLGLSLSSSAQVTGAIFTTTSTGTTVNGNIYLNNTDVYLNGGPQNMNSAGLPDGTYYFQVTDPSGSVLLSTDLAICRELSVTHGVVSGSTGTCPHPTGSYNSKNGSTTVQLAPFSTTPNAGGEYKVYLIAFGSATVGGDGYSLIFSNSDAKTDNFKVLNGAPTTPPTVTGFKFYDANANGVFDAGEVVIPGWKINALDTSTALLFYTYTGSNGYYTFPVDSNNTYTVSEVLPANSTWLATGCTSHTGQGDASTTCTSNTSATVVTGTAGTILGPDFGNVCTGAGGGLTLGFWSNKNGQSVLSKDPGWYTFLDGLNLRNANGTNYDPTSSTSLFATWLLNATATNMSYMLSAQLATMELNVRELYVNGSSLIYAPGTNSANTAGFASVNAIMTEANTALGADGYAISGDPNRAYQQALKNALDQANNNINFVQPGPASCPFITPY